MAKEFVPAPTRTNEQLVPVKARLPTGKRNLLMDLQKNFQLDELWFNLNDDLLCKALGITPKDSAHPFVPPPAGDLGVVTKTNVHYAELVWEEFIQAIKNFFSDMANIKVPTKKPKPHVIPYCQFTKLIIYYLGSQHNIHRRPQSPVHITIDDYPLGNLKFVSKG
ncbi:hypothetical protein Tco_0529844 [Tanacetum coccineum]